MQHTIITMVTPEIASKFLAKNGQNRKISKNQLHQVSSSMRGGHWEITHNAVAIASDGELVDGQHRLQAVVNTGIPELLPITYLPNSSCRDCVDRAPLIEKHMLILDAAERSVGRNLSKMEAKRWYSKAKNIYTFIAKKDDFDKVRRLISFVETYWQSLLYSEYAISNSKIWRSYSGSGAVLAHIYDSRGVENIPCNFITEINSFEKKTGVPVIDSLKRVRRHLEIFRPDSRTIRRALTISAANAFYLLSLGKSNIRTIPSDKLLFNINIFGKEIGDGDQKDKKT